jgi:DNA modification methylase
MVMPSLGDVMTMESAWGLHVGDVLDGLAALPDRSVQVVVTSPPYWSLRQYEGVSSGIWGGRQACEHQLDGDVCRACGAWLGLLGNEPTLDQYIDNLVEVWRGIWRVLRDDGTCWLNLGTTYAGFWGKLYAHKPWGEDRTPDASTPPDKATPDWSSIGVKPGDDLLVPHRVAMALQADGWVVRSAVVWAKGISFRPEWSGSVMPESVNGWRWERHRIRGERSARISEQGYAAAGGHRDNPGGGLSPNRADHDGRNLRSFDGWVDCPGCDKCCETGGLVLRKGSWRPTSAYEMVFLLTKGMDYYCDAAAIRESFVDDRCGRDGSVQPIVRNRGARDDGCTKPNGIHPSERGGRNPRSVWAMSNKPKPWAHFATFPDELVAPMIRVSTPDGGCCVGCGAPYARVETREKVGRDVEFDRLISASRTGRGDGRTDGPNHAMDAVTATSQWLPTCRCELGSAPSVVLDPFMGSGTTGVVALRLGRRVVGIEASGQYAEELIVPRMAAVHPEPVMAHHAMVDEAGDEQMSLFAG